MTESRISSPSIIPDLPKADLSEVIGLPVKKRSVVIYGHKTSLSIEDPFWSAYRQLADQRGISMSDLLQTIDGELTRKQNFSSGCRLYVLATYKALIEQQARTILKLEQEIDQLRGKGGITVGTAETEARK
jgi:predicted DNA-binding ribbon-helix-helix protein